MRRNQISTVFRNQFTGLLLMIIFLSITQYSYSQKNSDRTDSTYFFKNALKGKTTLIYYVIYAYAGISAGYERYISKHSALELGGYYSFFLYDVYQYHWFCVMPEYKYFTVSNKKALDNLWISAYLTYSIQIRTDCEDCPHNYWDPSHSFGIGASIGKKLYLTKNERCFIDIGFGVSYNKRTDNSIFWLDTQNYLLRPIIQMGWKF